MSELEQNENGAERLFEEVIVENFPNLTTHKFIDPRFQMKPKQNKPHSIPARTCHL